MIDRHFFPIVEHQRLFGHISESPLQLPNIYFCYLSTRISDLTHNIDILSKKIFLLMLLIKLSFYLFYRQPQVVYQFFRIHYLTIFPQQTVNNNSSRNKNE